MIVSVLSLYDTYLEDLFVRLTSPPLFSSIVNHCGVSFLCYPRMGIIKVHQ